MAEVNYSPLKIKYFYLSHLDILVKRAMELIQDIAFKFDVDRQCHQS